MRVKKVIGRARVQKVAKILESVKYHYRNGPVRSIRYHLLEVQLTMKKKSRQLVKPLRPDYLAGQESIGKMSIEMTKQKQVQQIKIDLDK